MVPEVPLCSGGAGSLLYPWAFPAAALARSPTMSEEIATRPTTGVGIPRSDPGLPFANHSTGHPSVAAEPSHKPASGIPDVTSDAQSAMQIHLHGFPCLYVSEEGDGSTAEPTCEEIEHEIRRCREESDAANINDPYLLAARRAALGIALESRYLHTWDAEDLEERLAMWRAALATLTGPVNAFGASRQDGTELKHLAPES